MALIKCPECGHEVSTLADSCPNCGYPLKPKKDKNVVKENETSEYPAPIGAYWTIEWYKKNKRVKIIWFLVFILCVIGAGVIAFFYQTDRDISQQGLYPKQIYNILLVISGVICLALLITLIVIIIKFKVKVRKLEGYTCLIYKGLYNLYVIEDKVVAKSPHTTLYGRLPNGKNTKATISGGELHISIDQDEAQYYQ